MAVPSFEPVAGTVTLDGEPFALVSTQDGGWQWTETHRAIIPGPATQEESAVARAEPGYFRTWGMSDWSFGIGAALHQAGDKRFSYSFGPSGELPGKFVRGQQYRTATMAGSSGRERFFFEIATALYYATGNYVQKINTTLNAETVATAITTSGVSAGTSLGVQLSGYTLTEASPPWFDGTSTKVFMGSRVANTHYIVAFDGTTWTQDNDTIVGSWALSDASDGLRLWASSSVADTTGTYVCNLPAGGNPFTGPLGSGSWSGKFQLSNRARFVTGMASLQGGVLVATGDGGLYTVDYSSGIPHPLVDSRDGQPSTLGLAGLESGRWVRTWNGRAMIPTANGLSWYDEGNNLLEAIGPEHLVGNEGAIRGQCSALFTGDPEWLYAAFSNEVPDSYVVRGRLPREGEQTNYRMLWFPVARFASNRIVALHVSHLGTNPLLCMGDTSNNVFFLTLPRPGKTVLNDSNCRSEISATNSNTYLSDTDLGRPTTRKTFWRTRFRAVNVTSSEYLNVYFRVDRGNYVPVGSIQHSGEVEINLPQNTEGVTCGIAFQWIGTLNTAAWPYLEAVEVDFTEDGAAQQSVDAAVFIQDGKQTQVGVMTGQASLWAKLNHLFEQRHPFQVITPHGEQHWAKLDRAVGLTSKAVADVQDKMGPGRMVTFRLNLYDRLLLLPEGRYDVGDEYGVAQYDGAQFNAAGVVVADAASVQSG